jgi:D-alanyl-D-alanine carboxypeptidase
MRLLSAVVAMGLLVAVAACGGSAGGSVTIVPSVDPTATVGPGTPTNTLAPGETPAPTATQAEPTVWTDPLPCGDILAPVNKMMALASDCEPPQRVAVPGQYVWTAGQEVTPETLDALIPLLEAAVDDGFEVFVQSSYRSYATQDSTFQGWVAELGQTEAERISARPGHSEHQLGTTVDLTVARNGTNLDLFVGTPEADWVADNAWRFGFVVSYPPGMEEITGYVWEPWHIRFVGEDIARAIQESGLTPGEFLLQR